MPGVRDRNLRSGDLHEELGLVLLRTVALVAPVPRPEDVGAEAFVTLLRPEGSRKLLPSVSFLVQIKAESVSTINYTGSDAVSWLKNLEVPFLIGRVNLSAARIELFSTQRLHQILLERHHEGICLKLDQPVESPDDSAERHANLGPAIHTWSLEDAEKPDFLANAHAILQPHVESLARNRRLREIEYQEILDWRTSQVPSAGATMILGSSSYDIKTTLVDMVPHVQRLLNEIASKRRYGSYSTIANLIEMMRHWGVDPDPTGSNQLFAAIQATGPEISDEEVIAIRYHVSNLTKGLILSGSGISESSLMHIPVDTKTLSLANLGVTDAGVEHLLRLTELDCLNLSGTAITDHSLDRLCTLDKLVVLCLG